MSIEYGKAISPRQRSEVIGDCSRIIPRNIQVSSAGIPKITPLENRSKFTTPKKKKKKISVTGPVTPIQKKILKYSAKVQDTPPQLKKFVPSIVFKKTPEDPNSPLTDSPRNTASMYESYYSTTSVSNETNTFRSDKDYYKKLPEFITEMGDHRSSDWFFYFQNRDNECPVRSWFWMVVLYCCGFFVVLSILLIVSICFLISGGYDSFLPPNPVTTDMDVYYENISKRNAGFVSFGITFFCFLAGIILFIFCAVIFMCCFGRSTKSAKLDILNKEIIVWSNCAPMFISCVPQWRWWNWLPYFEKKRNVKSIKVKELSTQRPIVFFTARCKRPIIDLNNVDIYIQSKKMERFIFLENLRVKDAKNIKKFFKEKLQTLFVQPEGAEFLTPRGGKKSEVIVRSVTSSDNIEDEFEGERDSELSNDSMEEEQICKKENDDEVIELEEDNIIKEDKLNDSDLILNDANEFDLGLFEEVKD